MARFAALLLLAAAFAPASAFAVNITVTTTADSQTPDSLCSLREAVLSAALGPLPNGCAFGTPGLDTIVIPAGNYTVSAGMIPLDSNLILSGQGPAVTGLTRSGATLSRVFWIPATVTVEIAGIKITGGRGVDGSSGSGSGGPGGAGEDGGAILNGGTLTLTNVLLTGNRAGNGGTGGLGGISTGGVGGAGGKGGAVYSSGSLTINNSTISGNQAGNGGTGGSGAGATSGPGGAGGNGGGIHSAAALTVTSSTIADNSAGAAGIGGSGPSPGSAGLAGGGGGLYTSSAATVTGTTISGNTAGSSAPGQGSALAAAGGDGGGILNNVGTLTLTNSSVSGNATTAGGSSLSGVSQAGGDGGGLANAGGIVTVSGSTFSGNSSGQGGTGNLAGAGGLGGGIATFTGRLTLQNVTVAGNRSGNGGFSGMNQGAAGAGGGIAFVDGDLILLHTTVAGNSIGSGNLRLGGGIYSSGIGDPAASLQNSVVAGNTPQNCSRAGFGTISDRGHTVSFPDTTCPGVHADPKLGPLQDNGGPTPTMALLPGSAAIDRVPPAADCLATDQRGVPRPTGSACDSGGFEFVPPPVALDVTAPISTLILKRQLLGAALRKGFVARFTTNEPGKAVLELFTNVRTRPAARIVRMRVAVGTKTIAASGQYKIVAKFTRKAKKRFARANRLVVSVRLTVSDAAGNKTVKTKRVVLRR